MLPVFKITISLLMLSLLKMCPTVKVSGQKVQPVGAPFLTIRTSPRPLGRDISAVFTNI